MSVVAQRWCQINGSRGSHDVASGAGLAVPGCVTVGQGGAVQGDGDLRAAGGDGINKVLFDIARGGVPAGFVGDENHITGAGDGIGPGGEVGGLNMDYQG